MGSFKTTWGPFWDYFDAVLLYLQISNGSLGYDALCDVIAAPAKARKRKYNFTIFSRIHIWSLFSKFA